MNRSALVFIALGAAILAGLFLLLRPDSGAPDATAPSVAAVAQDPAITPPPGALPGEPGPVPPGSEPLPAEPAMTAEWVVRQGRRESGPAVVVLKAGDEVELRVTSDSNDELHLHGYDLSLPLRAGQTGSLRFRAQHSGRFELELHHRHLELAALEVRPQ
ncbi:hypothetical protein [Solimonas sp. SE-A11]|uniref:hypothetical protein n=1 Tax=Solimonas sp. SE-A11 TaxID=3054954 RepID=UPI00259C9ECC|nr:hypothetical protein [Solimonas sp. SE-A11]MDM4771341.1 hypothetical protein [Solimonas sp. SE-A11]